LRHSRWRLTKLCAPTITFDMPGTCRRQRYKWWALWIEHWEE
jgi:hypothetical protein